MLLSNSLFCVILSSLLYVSTGRSPRSPEEDLQATTGVLLGSLFGNRNVPTCEGENCKFEDSQPGEWEAIDSAEYVIDYEETKPGYEENTLPEVQTEVVQGDEYTKFCRDLTSVIKDIEHLNPEFKTAKHEVLEKFGRYSREFASQIKKCYTRPAAVQLLDLIILVAEKIKSEYISVEEGPCPEQEQQTGYEHVEEIVAEEMEEADLSPGFVGSVRGIPGQHFPNYTEVPITSFSCADAKYIPGFYADLETGCQVFHVCYEHRRESFLCPVGTIFNQPILACDYWYSSNCSLAPVYYDVNKQTEEVSKPGEMESTIGALITTIIEGEEPVMPEVPVEITKDVQYEQHDIADIVKFLPVKAEVFEFPEPIAQKPMQEDELAASIYETVVSSGTSMASKTKQVMESIPEPAIVKTVVIEPKMVSIPGKKVAKVAAIKASVPFVAKAKLAAAAIPVAKAMKIAIPVATAVKASVPLVKAAAVKAKMTAAVPFVKVAAVKSAAPVVAKVKIAAAAIPATKIAAAKASVPLLAKAKFAAAAPLLKAKVAVPVVKMVAASSFKAALPVAKTKASVVPVMKAKIAKTASLQLVKGKMVALPLAKAKLAGATVPFVKAKAAGLPLAKLAAVKAIPVVKGKVAKAAMLSPLTKKALALGYMKLLKAKKLGMMG